MGFFEDMVVVFFERILHIELRDKAAQADFARAFSKANVLLNKFNRSDIPNFDLLYDAIPELDYAVKRNGSRKERAESYLTRGLCCGKLESWQDAVISYQECVKLDSQHPLGWLNLGKALLSLQKTDEARTALRTHCELHPKNSWEAQLLLQSLEQASIEATKSASLENDRNIVEREKP